MSNEDAGLRRSTRSGRNTTSMAECNEAQPNNILKKPERENCTFIEYKGAIKYFHEYNDIAAASDDIMQWLNTQVDQEVCPMAFDMEWPFSFQTGPGKSAVIQICVELTCCYVFQLTNLPKLPAVLLSVLKHPKVRLHGVNIKNDFRKLARDFPEVNADELIANCVDLSVWCNTICETGGRWSLDRLSKFVVKKCVDKNKKVRMSKWHIIPLNQNQLLYAAIDVYIGQLIYLELERRLKAKELNAAKFKDEFGEAAFKAKKALGETFIN